MSCRARSWRCWASRVAARRHSFAIAAGVDAPTSGRVLLDGREVASPTVFVPPEKRSVGLMFQDYALFPHLTVLKNVMFGLTALDRRARADEARAALDRVGLLHLAESYPHEISGGEQQRVALARAIVPRPGVLLMDEPFSGLDSRLRDSVRADTLSVLREAGATAVIVTHDPEEAMRMADRIVLMRGGKIVQEGLAEDLYDRPQSLFAARFFSALNELPGAVASGRVVTQIAEFRCGGHSEGASVVVAVRPRGVLLTRAGDSAKGTPGRIRTRYFLGEVELFEVAVEGLETYLLAKARAGDGLAPGADVSVSFDERDVLIFPESG